MVVTTLFPGGTSTAPPQDPGGTDLPPTDNNPPSTPTVPTATTPMAPATPTAPPAPTGLAAFVELDMREIDATYIKDSLTPLPGQSFTLYNISDTVDMQVSVRGTAGVSFTPPDFPLPHASSQGIVVTFDVTQMNSLPEGINTVSAIIGLSSNTIVYGPTSPPGIPPSQLGFFREDRYAGSSGTKGKLPASVIFAGPILFTQKVNNINYDDRRIPVLQLALAANNKITSPLRIPQGTTVRWTGDFNFATGGTYIFTITTDDGMLIKLDGATFFNQYHNQNPTPYTAQVPISAGVHEIIVEYYNDISNNTAMVSWALVPGSAAPTPPETPPATPATPTVPTTPAPPIIPAIPSTPQPPKSPLTPPPGVPVTPTAQQEPPSTPVIPVTPPTTPPITGGGGGGGLPPVVPVTPPVIPPTPPPPATPPFVPPPTTTKTGNGTQVQ